MRQLRIVHTILLKNVSTSSLVIFNSQSSSELTFGILHLYTLVQTFVVPTEGSRCFYKRQAHTHTNARAHAHRHMPSHTNTFSVPVHTHRDVCLAYQEFTAHPRTTSTHIHTHIHINTHTPRGSVASTNDKHTYTYAHVPTHAYTHTYSHTYTHAHVLSTCTHSQRHLFCLPRDHGTSTNGRLSLSHTHTYTYAHTRTCVRTCTRTHRYSEPVQTG